MRNTCLSWNTQCNCCMTFRTFKQERSVLIYRHRCARYVRNVTMATNYLRENLHEKLNFINLRFFIKTHLNVNQIFKHPSTPADPNFPSVLISLSKYLKHLFTRKNRKLLIILICEHIREGGKSLKLCLPAWHKNPNQLALLIET